MIACYIQANCILENSKQACYTVFAGNIYVVLVVSISLCLLFWTICAISIMVIIVFCIKSSKFSVKKYNDWLIDWLIDSIDFYTASAIFQPINGGDYQLKVINCEILSCEILFPWRPSRAYSSSKSSETV